MIFRALQFLRYGLVGLVGTVIQYAVLIVMTRLHAADAVLSSTIGAGLGACANYALNYCVTFKSRERHSRAAPKFFLVAAAGMAINAVLMSALVDRLNVQYLIAQCVSTACVLAAGFAVNSFWSFRSSHVE
jgi:putative flippase GtrA